ncbi:MAG: polysulfide reductase NrfD [Dehalococcoidales bacterium]|nr:polysulfide reductase NrfD [Dehalococcoidales bacterium]
MQSTRQWMVTHEWMINGNRQTEWIENRGLLLWLAFYTGGLGAGLFLVSLFFNSLPAMIAGWAIVAVLKGGFHLLYLGRPARFWRLVMHPGMSWLSRGLLFVLGFAGIGMLVILLQYFAPEHTVILTTFKAISAVLAACVATYTGLVLNNVKGVPYWNSSLLPLLFATCSLLGGFGMITAIGHFSGGLNMHAAETGSRILLVVNVLIITAYLAVSSGKKTVGKKSVLFQLRGGASPVFWIGVVLLGIVIPAVIAIFSLLWAESTTLILVLGTVCEITGGAALRYCVLKSAIYNPVIAGEYLRKAK